MNNKNQLLILAIILVLTLGCSMFEPEVSTGSIQIRITRESDDNGSLAKTSEYLDHLQCILKKGDSVVHSELYYSIGGFFQIIIKNLQPADNYSILLWGFNESNNLAGQGTSDNIEVKSDDITSVTLIWEPFKLELKSPRVD